MLLQQQGLVPQGVEDVVLRQPPSVALVELEALSVGPRCVLLLPSLGEAVAGQDDVEGVLTH